MGLGGGSLRGLSSEDGERLIHHAIDLGINLIDTAPSYGRSEHIIGRAVRDRREEVVLSTKVGYGVPGILDWTPKAVSAGIDLARDRLAVDCIDVVHLHSCPTSVLLDSGVTEALFEARGRGKIQCAAYSGDGHELYVATDLGFDGVQATLSVVDQHNRPTLDLARKNGQGVLAKRSLANAPWRFREPPDAPDVRENYRRYKRLGLEVPEPAGVFIRWVIHHAGVDAALVGTSSVLRLQAAAKAAERGPLDSDILSRVETAWKTHGSDWTPLV